MLNVLMELAFLEGWPITSEPAESPRSKGLALILESEPEFRPVDPECGDLMTKEEWLMNVESGGFMSYDGYGHLAMADKVSDIEISPSDVDGYLWPKWCTHIVWYNR